MIKLLLLLSLFLGHVWAQDLYSSVFGDQSYEAELNSFINKTNIGDLLYKVQGESVLSLKKDIFLNKMKLILKDQELKKLKFKNEWIKVSELPFKLVYDPSSLNIVIDIPYEKLKPTFKYMDNNPEIKYAGLAINPAPIGGGVSLNAEQRNADSFFGGDYQSLFYDSFINVNGYVFESRGFYENNIESDEDPRWFQGNKSLTRDFKDQRIRVQLGDTQSQNFGFLNSYQVGGLSVNRRFSINPYDRPFPQGTEEFQLETRSRVKTYVNGSLIKDEYLPAGNYRFNNLPLINGLNFVRVEVINEFGEVKILDYDIPTSINLLGEGEDNFSFAMGKPFSDQNFERIYEDENLATAFYQKGINSYYTVGGYAQGFDNFSLFGMSHGMASRHGNIFYELSRSENKGDAGFAHSLNYQFQLQGKNYFNGFSSILRYENFQDKYSNALTLPSRFLKEALSLNLSAPLSNSFSLNLGAGLATYQDMDLDKREQLNFAANWRMNRAVNLNFYSTRTKNFDGDEVLASSVFLTWNFDDTRNYLTVYRDMENQETRTTVTHDNNNELYHPLVNLTLETSDNEDDEAGDLNVKLPTPMADLNFRGAYANTNEGYKGLQSIRVGTSLLFAMDDEFAYSIGRPNSNSFALFKTSEALKDQKISLRSTSPYADTANPIIGDIALTDLVAYQYREVTINPIDLEDGISLEREKFVLYPTYKSANLINLKENGVKTIQGRITKDGKAMSLKIGKLNGKVFFTDREGNFFIEGIKESKLTLEIEGQTSVIDLDKKDTGIINIGIINLD